MRRAVVLSALVALGAFSVVLGGQQGPVDAAKRIEVEKLRENLFVLRGGGGNTGVFVTTKGVVVVDSKNPGWGQPLLDTIKGLTPKPVTHLINTHTHFDHVSGNVEFPTTIEIVAHQNTAQLMKEMRTVTGYPPQDGNIFTEHKGRGLPTRTFTSTLSIGNGADQVDLHYFGRGHTSGDAWVVFPSQRVVHAGDIFPGKNLPILDANNGGSGLEIGDTLAKAAAGLKGVDTIITGHSTQMTLADLREYAELNRDFATAVREGKKAGRTIDEITKAWTLPSRYAGYSAPPAARLRTNVEVVYNEIK